MKVSGSEGETSSGGGSKETEDKSPAKDYIHVRARRGQATDRHSLAERVCVFSRFCFPIILLLYDKQKLRLS